jgi:hypothetical protein
VAIHSSYSLFTFLASSRFRSGEETISDVGAFMKQTLLPCITWAQNHSEVFVALRVFFMSWCEGRERHVEMYELNLADIRLKTCLFSRSQHEQGGCPLSQQVIEAPYLHPEGLEESSF